MSVRNKTSHTAFSELPVVDISLLFSDQIEDRQQVAKQLDQASRDAGFLYLKGHQIAPSLIDELTSATKAYFSQSNTQKMANYIGLSENHSGYVPQGEEQFYSQTVDLKEAYDLGYDDSSLMARFTQNGCNQWPDHPALKTAAKAYYDAMLNLSKVLFRGFALALGLPEDAFTKSLTHPPSQLRLIHYFDNPDAKPTDSGIGAHTDYEFITILLPTSAGLQVLNGADEWINVPVLESAFVINIGDMMELVSDGRYVATSHRVRQVKEERYAFPFFCNLDYETVVKPNSVKPYSAEPMSLVHEHSDMNQEPSIICGDHLLAQTIQTFGYLKKRLERGEISMPQGAKELASFGKSALKQG